MLGKQFHRIERINNGSYETSLNRKRNDNLSHGVAVTLHEHKNKFLKNKQGCYSIEKRYLT